MLCRPGAQVRYLWFAIVAFMLLGCSSEPTGITIVKKLDNDLKKYTTANVVVTFSNPRRNTWNLYTDIVADYIGSELTKNSIENVYGNTIADLKIVTVITTGLGMPRLTHNYSIQWVYLDSVNVKIIDISNNTLLAEARWVRNWKNDDDTAIGGKLIKLLIATANK